MSARTRCTGRLALRDLDKVAGRRGGRGCKSHYYGIIFFNYENTTNKYNIVWIFDITDPGPFTPMFSTNLLML